MMQLRSETGYEAPAGNAMPTNVMEDVAPKSLSLASGVQLEMSEAATALVNPMDFLRLKAGEFLGGNAEPSDIKGFEFSKTVRPITPEERLHNQWEKDCTAADRASEEHGVPKGDVVVVLFGGEELQITGVKNVAQVIKKVADHLGSSPYYIKIVDVDDDTRSYVMSEQPPARGTAVVTFPAGTRVEYWSKSSGNTWISADLVKDYRQGDNYYNLNVKPNALPENVRLPGKPE